MATDDNPELSPQPSGGHGATRKLGPLPVWAWALIAGAGVGVIWFLRRGSSAAAAPTTAADPTQESGTDNSGAGMGDSQFNALWGALQTIQGELSKEDEGAPVTGPTTPVTPPPKNGNPNPPPARTPTPKPIPKPKYSSITVTLGPGMTLSSVAKSYGQTAAALWAYNITPGVRSDGSEATLKSRGINNGFRQGSTIYVPSSWKKK